MVRRKLTFAWLLLLAGPGSVSAQEDAASADVQSVAAQQSADEGDGGENRPLQRPERRGRGFGGPIELGPDDKPAFDDPPADFKVVRDDVPHGKLEMIEYDSKSRRHAPQDERLHAARIRGRRRSIRCSTCCTASAATRRNGSVCASPR